MNQADLHFRPTIWIPTFAILLSGVAWGLVFDSLGIGSNFWLALATFWSLLLIWIAVIVIWHSRYWMVSASDITFYKGIFHKTTVRLSLQDIKTFHLKQNWLQKSFGIASVIVEVRGDQKKKCIRHLDNFKDLLSALDQVSDGHIIRSIKASKTVSITASELKGPQKSCQVRFYANHHFQIAFAAQELSEVFKKSAYANALFLNENNESVFVYGKVRSHKSGRLPKGIESELKKMNSDLQNNSKDSLFVLFPRKVQVFDENEKLKLTILLPGFKK